jgi:hypothetical protein
MACTHFQIFQKEFELRLRTFEQFVEGRRYITNVSESTVRWYWCSWEAWKKYQPDFIINARQAGVSAATLNC